MLRVLLLLTWLFIGVVSVQYRDPPSSNTTVLETVETDHLIISRYVLDFPNFDALAAQAEEIYAYVSRRMGTELEDKLAVSVYEPMGGACPVRGSLGFSLEFAEGEAAPETLEGIYDGTPELSIFADETTSLEQLLGVLAHELGHALHHQGFAPFPAPSGFTEGLATWAAGSYWTDWQQSASLSDSVRTYFENGTFLALQDDIELRGVYPNDATGACLTRRNTLYTEWAAFSEFLISEYSLGTFRKFLSTSEAVYQEEEITFTELDFLGVYGKSFETLQEDWLESTALRRLPGQPFILPISRSSQ